MISQRSISLFAALALTVSGTSALAAQRPPRPQVRDSAGVRITEYATIRNLPTAFRIAEKPRLDFGGERENPDHELNPRAPFRSVIRLSDGRFVVSDYSDFKVFDASGRYVATIGREGDGPGEFRQVRGVCLGRADTIIALSYSAPRFSLFDRNGSHIRSVSIAGGYLLPSGCLGDGTMLQWGRMRTRPNTMLPPEQASRLDLVVEITRVDSKGSRLQVVGDFPASFLGAQFQNHANVVAQRDRLVAGNGVVPEYRVYSQNGRLLQIVRWRDPLVVVTDAMLEEAVKSSIPRGAPASEFPVRLANARSRPQPKTLPAYSQIQVDDAGRVWVRDYYFRSPQPIPWTVFDSSGQVLGRVVPPTITGARAVEIMSMFRDDVLLRWMDPDGFVHVAFHSIAPAR